MQPLLDLFQCGVLEQYPALTPQQVERRQRAERVAPLVRDRPVGVAHDGPPLRGHLTERPAPLLVVRTRVEGVDVQLALLHERPYSGRNLDLVLDERARRARGAIEQQQRVVARQRRERHASAVGGLPVQLRGLPPRAVAVRYGKQRREAFSLGGLRMPRSGQGFQYRDQRLLVAVGRVRAPEVVLGGLREAQKHRARHVGALHDVARAAGDVLIRKEARDVGPVGERLLVGGAVREPCRIPEVERVPPVLHDVEQLLAVAQRIGRKGRVQAPRRRRGLPEAESIPLRGACTEPRGVKLRRGCQKQQTHERQRPEQARAGEGWVRGIVIVHSYRSQCLRIPARRRPATTPYAYSCRSATGTPRAEHRS